MQIKLKHQFNSLRLSNLQEKEFEQIERSRELDSSIDHNYRHTHKSYKDKNGLEYFKKRDSKLKYTKKEITDICSENNENLNDKERFNDNKSFMSESIYCSLILSCKSKQRFGI